MAIDYLRRRCLQPGHKDLRPRRCGCTAGSAGRSGLTADSTTVRMHTRRVDSVSK